MENITDVRDFCITGKFDIAASFKADGDSTETKTVTLRFVMDHVPLLDIITPALSTKRISWVNMARTKFTTWKNRSTIEVDFTSPAKRVVTREESIEVTTNSILSSRVIDAETGKPVTRDVALKLATFSYDNPIT